jgi:hypothetical protein
MADEPHNEGIPGRWYGPGSLGPFREVVRFVEECDDYTKELRFKHQAAVFKAHPGIRSTFLTDMAGLDFVFDAPADDLDRLDGDPGFGGLAYHADTLGGVVPALMAQASGTHAAARAVVMEAMTLRRAAFEPACQRVIRYGIPMLRTASRGVAVNFQHAMHHAAVSVAFEWLFDIAPGPSGADAQRWIRGCFGLKSDLVVANLVARGLSRAKTRLRDGSAAAQRAYGARWMERIRQSDPYQKEFRAAAHRAGVPERELPAHLMFAASFNATGGAWATLHPALAQLSVDAVTRARLAAEVQGFAGSLRELDALPELDAFFLESMRLFGRPRHYYRRAVRDLTLPVSDGSRVPIKAGTTLCLVATVARQDPTVWGDDASVFDTQRFLRGDAAANAALRKRVRPFGPHVDGAQSFGCAGGAAARMLWKALAVPLARSTDWRLSPWPEPDVDAFDGVRPGELDWIRT